MSEETRLEHGQSFARVEPQHCRVVILAGGEGMRLRPLVRQVFAADRPKQYVRLLGPRTLLRQTLDRVSLAIPELGAGHLWNTSVLVGKVATPVQTGWQALPDLSDRLAHIEPFVGTPEEADAVRQAYELGPG